VQALARSEQFDVAGHFVEMLERCSGARGAQLRFGQSLDHGRLLH